MSFFLRKYSFTARIVNTWNSLPESVIAAETTNCFNYRLNKFRNNQEMIFDYKAEITVIGNRSNIIYNNVLRYSIYSDVA